MVCTDWELVTRSGDDRKEGNVLFNDALNTFYLKLYGVGHMVKDHSDSAREETRCPNTGYSFRLSARVIAVYSKCYLHSHNRVSPERRACFSYLR